ncbi:hypothetical protein [Streptosporangium sp. NPDC002721]|uniref:hypothetical protein n=1 Tax=Streptosporangium sp. NPDC002721 TaxID=3366188 RepID=UPI00367BE4E9
MNDFTEEIINVLYPDPTPQPDESRMDFVQRRVLASNRRDVEREELKDQIKRADDAFDPLISELRELGRAKREIEEQMRLLVAYGREFVRPEPYRLAPLAEAAGMSISGVRGMYGSSDIQRVANAIGRSDRKNETKPNADPKIVPEKGLDIYGRFAPAWPLYPEMEVVKPSRPQGASELPSPP